MIKKCTQCKKAFSKPYKYSRKQWDNAQFCAKSCKDSSQIGIPFTEERVLKMSINHLGQTAWNKGRRGFKYPPRSAETRKRMSESKKGEKSHFWRGGITSEHRKIRSSAEYREWRAKVLKRDNYECIECGAISVPLQADHIKPFASFPELRFEVSNGRTLCVPCHQLTPTWGNVYVRNKNTV